MILHLKSPNAICISQQSDLLMYSSGQKKGGYPVAHCITHQNGRDAPCDFNTIKYTKIRLFFAALHPLLQNRDFTPKWSIFFYLFGRIDALLQGFLVLLRSILFEPGDEKTCLRGFGQLRFNMVCSVRSLKFRIQK